MDYNFKGSTQWLKQPDRFFDIVKAPAEIAKYSADNRCFFLRYEDLVNAPKKEIQKLYNYLGLPRLPNQGLGSYNIDEVFRNTTSIDTRSIQKHQVPVKNYLNRWIQSINSSQKKRLLLEYLDYLDAKILEKLGYSKPEIIKTVKAIDLPWSPWTISFKLSSANYGRGLSLKERVWLAVLQKIKK